MCVFFKLTMVLHCRPIYFGNLPLLTCGSANFGSYSGGGQTTTKSVFRRGRRKSVVLQICQVKTLNVKPTLLLWSLSQPTFTHSMF